ncbi:hypothetical protein CcaverHIS002_0506830 [Cutaneotrichosporon cavernicola]|uniref:histone deacetylase n=1 Tax=Cutaneotrichosporon cavernicola TaxID=279322 RepID=A0AA48QX83_9TREE|nr:uncharacterized protein CcaverHIS019_0507360 [Cutaneotrichosporon cavernicola]BEI85282.1 hypothetical protein CcaverHIS002_0506830 [Cutaneotrichosporon cavernicola]BEI93108.1 hypothetical protein CcaverHIS019_0507360 [Cutaneotrichosporon cavernicola]BEJ00885.1 hypothetical protein CcaverHIS631_0507420 [Cutaneotrichosporon cavernicola]BEJ08651.1 hypothetical protein CcaverHIS641_0507450 [Cutaneotrichosporon cavernicola]
MDFSNVPSTFPATAQHVVDSNAMDVDAPAGPSNTTAFEGNADASASQVNGVDSSLQRVHLSQPMPPYPTMANPNLTFFYEDADNDSDSVVEKGRMVRTGYVFDPLMMLHCADGYTPTEDIHDSGEGHPEEPMRIKRIFNRLKEQGLIRRMKRLDFAEAQKEQVRLVHTDDHWHKVQGTETFTDEYIQETKNYYDHLSLYVCRETGHCARLSCGGVIQACRSVCEGEVRNAFAIVRPPGHHAEPDEHMGFCFFNNVAVAAREVQRQGLAKKVLILDWDVHHGNGTQRAFWDDPNVLYISIHRHDGGKFYPSSDFGALDMVGEGEGEGTSVNIPWPGPGFGDGDYIYAFQKIVMPIAYEFAPDLVIISAGFDAADGDQLGCCNVTPAGYGHMTHMLCALAGGKVVVALEGGYNLRAISDSSLAVAQVLLGETPAEIGQVQASELATEVIHEVAKVQSKYWKNVNAAACAPPEIGKGGGEYVTTVPDLLKQHRLQHMYTKHKLFTVPLANTDLHEWFQNQVLVNEGLYESETETLVIFAHDFGNLRVETDGVASVDVSLANSYLLDTSDAVVDWVRGRGWNLIDINVLRNLRSQFAKGPRMVSNSGDKMDGQLMRYLWDNYVELSSAKNVVLIGHGTACGAVMELVNHRDVQSKVKAIVQVAGMHSIVRPDPTNENRRTWFRDVCQIYLPHIHPLLGEERLYRRIGGQLRTARKAKVVDVLVEALPEIKEFVDSKLDPVQTNGHAIVDVV